MSSANSGKQEVRGRGKFSAYSSNSGGKDSGNKKEPGGHRSYGSQFLNKAQVSRRAPAPILLPSLKSQTGNNDPNVNLVPPGGAGWGYSSGGNCQVGSENNTRAETASKPSRSRTQPWSPKADPMAPTYFGGRDLVHGTESSALRSQKCKRKPTGVGELTNTVISQTQIGQSILEHNPGSRDSLASQENQPTDGKQTVLRNELDEITKGDMVASGWALAHNDELDYSAKIVFSDEEDDERRDMRLVDRSEKERFQMHDIHNTDNGSFLSQYYHGAANPSLSMPDTSQPPPNLVAGQDQIRQEPETNTFEAGSKSMGLRPDHPSTAISPECASSSGASAASAAAAAAAVAAFTADMLQENEPLLQESEEIFMLDILKAKVQAKNQAIQRARSRKEEECRLRGNFDQQPGQSIVSPEADLHELETSGNDQYASEANGIQTTEVPKKHLADLEARLNLRRQTSHVQSVPKESLQLENLENELVDADAQSHKKVGPFEVKQQEEKQKQGGQMHSNKSDISGPNSEVKYNQQKQYDSSLNATGSFASQPRDLESNHKKGASGQNKNLQVQQANSNSARRTNSQSTGHFGAPGSRLESNNQKLCDDMSKCNIADVTSSNQSSVPGLASGRNQSYGDNASMGYNTEGVSAQNSEPVIGRNSKNSSKSNDVASKGDQASKASARKSIKEPTAPAAAEVSRNAPNTGKRSACSKEAQRQSKRTVRPNQPNQASCEWFGNCSNPNRPNSSWSKHYYNYDYNYYGGYYFDYYGNYYYPDFQSTQQVKKRQGNGTRGARNAKPNTDIRPSQRVANPNGPKSSRQPRTSRGQPLQKDYSSEQDDWETASEGVESEKVTETDRKVKQRFSNAQRRQNQAQRQFDRKQKAEHRAQQEDKQKQTMELAVQKRKFNEVDISNVAAVVNVDNLPDVAADEDGAEFVKVVSKKDKKSKKQEQKRILLEQKRSERRTASRGNSSKQRMPPRMTAEPLTMNEAAAKKPGGTVKDNDTSESAKQGVKHSNQNNAKNTDRPLNQNQKQQQQQANRKQPQAKSVKNNWKAKVEKGNPPASTAAPADPTPCPTVTNSNTTARKPDPIGTPAASGSFVSKAVQPPSIEEANKANSRVMTHSVVPPSATTMQAEKSIAEARDSGIETSIGIPSQPSSSRSSPPACTTVSESHIVHSNHQMAKSFVKSIEKPSSMINIKPQTVCSSEAFSSSRDNSAEMLTSLSSNSNALSSCATSGAIYSSKEQTKFAQVASLWRTESYSLQKTTVNDSMNTYRGADLKEESSLSQSLLPPSSASAQSSAMPFPTLSSGSLLGPYPQSSKVMPIDNSGQGSLFGNSFYQSDHGVSFVPSQSQYGHTSNEPSNCLQPDPTGSKVMTNNSQNAPFKGQSMPGMHPSALIHGNKQIVDHTNNLLPPQNVLGARQSSYFPQTRTPPGNHNAFSGIAPYNFNMPMKAAPGLPINRNSMNAKIESPKQGSMPQPQSQSAMYGNAAASPFSQGIGGSTSGFYPPNAFGLYSQQSTKPQTNTSQYMVQPLIQAPMHGIRPMELNTSEKPPQLKPNFGPGGIDFSSAPPMPMNNSANMAMNYSTGDQPPMGLASQMPVQRAHSGAGMEFSNPFNYCNLMPGKANTRTAPSPSVGMAPNSDKSYEQRNTLQQHSHAGQADNVYSANNLSFDRGAVGIRPNSGRVRREGNPMHQRNFFNRPPHQSQPHQQGQRPASRD